VISIITDCFFESNSVFSICHLSKLSSVATEKDEENNDGRSRPGFNNNVMVLLSSIVNCGERTAR
jgi:hypothetical protein